MGAVLPNCGQALPSTQPRAPRAGSGGSRKVTRLLSGIFCELLRVLEEDFLITTVMHVAPSGGWSFNAVSLNKKAASPHKEFV